MLAVAGPTFNQNRPAAYRQVSVLLGTLHRGGRSLCALEISIRRGCASLVEATQRRLQSAWWEIGNGRPLPTVTSLSLVDTLLGNYFIELLHCCTQAFSTWGLDWEASSGGKPRALLLEDDLEHWVEYG